MLLGYGTPRIYITLANVEQNRVDDCAGEHLTTFGTY